MVKCSECTHCKKEEERRKREEAARRLRSCREPSFAWRRFEYQDYWNNSDKFWQIRMDPTDSTVVWIQYGRNGTVGTKIKKEFTWSYEVRQYFTDKVKEKLGEGYSYKGTH